MSKSVGENLTRVLQGAAIIFVGEVAGKLFSFLTRTFAARYLGPTQYGLLALGTTVLYVTTHISLLGLRVGIVQRLPTAEDRSELFIVAAGITLLCSSAAAVVLYTFSAEISNLINEPAFAPVLRIFAVAVPLVALIRLSIGAFRGLENAVARILTRNFVQQGLTVLGILLAIVLELDVYALSTVWPVVSLVTLLFVLGVLYRWTPLLSVDAFTTKSVSVGELLSFSLPLMAMGVLWTLMRHTDNVLLSFFKNSGAVGQYDAAFTLSQLLLAVVTMFGFVFLPVFSSMSAEGDRSEMPTLYALVTKWIVFAGLPAVAVFALFPEFLLTLVFEKGYADSATAFVIITVGFTTHLLGGLNIQSLTAFEKTNTVAIGSAIAFVLNVILNVALIPRFGIAGAAMASMVSYGVSNLYLNVVLYRQFDIVPFGSHLAVSGATSVGLFAVAYLLFRSVATVDLLSVFLFSAVIGSIHLLVFFKLGLEPADLQVIERVEEATPFNLEILKREIDGDRQ